MIIWNILHGRNLNLWLMIINKYMSPDTFPATFRRSTDDRNIERVLYSLYPTGDYPGRL